MVTTTHPFDPASLLTTNIARAEFLSEALASNDAAIIADALGMVARAAGMTDIAERAGLGRDALDLALAAGGNPQLDTVVRVLAALGLKLEAAAPAG